MVSHWILSDNKSPQVARTLLSILDDLTNAVVYVVLIQSSISYSTNFLAKPLETVIQEIAFFFSFFLFFFFFVNYS